MKLNTTLIAPFLLAAAAAAQASTPTDPYTVPPGDDNMPMTPAPTRVPPKSTVHFAAAPSIVASDATIVAWADTADAGYSAGPGDTNMPVAQAPAATLHLAAAPQEAAPVPATPQLAAPQAAAATTAAPSAATPTAASERAASTPATATNITIAAAAADTSVNIKDFAFAPTATTVTVGTTVHWKNLDGEPHTVRSTDGSFASGALDQNDSYTAKFDKPGTYKYVCSIHPQMVGTIVVKAAN